MRIYHATLYTMEQTQPIPDGWVEIEDGKIVQIGTGEMQPAPGDIDFCGDLLLPGFVDAHTHLGIIENGIDFEGDDCNEATDPFTPQLRAIDGVNPMDLCFSEASSRGITSVLTSPGSANAAGGSILAMKTAGRCVDMMAIRTVGMKFALGENPKSVYNDKDETPITRMAIAGLLREGLAAAKRYGADLAAYEADPDNLDAPEFDSKHAALLPVLRREQKAFFHCHRADDMFTALRISREFDLDAVLIHATEGHLIADLLAAQAVPAIAGPILCDRCKPEMQQLRLQNAAALYSAGVPVAICTDHPVIPVQYLPLSALAAVKGGLPMDIALRTITICAAEIAGIADRVGSIKVGKDADLQRYSKHCNPLELLSDPLQVWISGQPIK